MLMAAGVVTVTGGSETVSFTVADQNQALLAGIAVCGYFMVMFAAAVAHRGDRRRLAAFPRRRRSAPPPPETEATPRSYPHEVIAFIYRWNAGPPQFLRRVKTKGCPEGSSSRSEIASRLSASRCR
jgi:hypothetical protein